MDSFPLALRSPSGKVTAVLMDGFGRCIYQGELMDIADAAMRAAPHGVATGDGWRFWRTLDGRSIVDLKSVRSAQDDTLGTVESAHDESSAAHWVWCFRERVRPYIVEAVQTRTTDLTPANAQLDSAQMECKFRDRGVAERLRTRLEDLCLRFNSQVGICMRASVATDSDPRDGEVVVTLTVRTAEPAPGPAVFPRSLVASVQTALSEAGFGPLRAMSEPWMLQNPFTHDKRRTPFTRVGITWEVDCRRYFWTKDGRGRSVPAGSQWEQDVRALSAVAALVDQKAPQMEVLTDTIRGTLTFLVED